MDDAIENSESNNEVNEASDQNEGNPSDLQSEEGVLIDDNDPVGVKKRLARQAKKHKREMQALEERLMQMQSQLGQNSAPQYDQNYGGNGYEPMHNPSGEDQIQRAVRAALEAREAEERRQRDMEAQQHVQRQYHRLNSEFDKAADKFDDFDDVVRNPDAPFTNTMRDTLLLLQNPAEVAYKLGKNPDELSRIAKLHPVDQAREINNLSFALMGGNTGNSSPKQGGNPLNPVKANPVTSSSAVTNSTTASEIRARMKSGTWK